MKEIKYIICFFLLGFVIFSIGCGNKVSDTMMEVLSINEADALVNYLGTPDEIKRRPEALGGDVTYAKYCNHYISSDLICDGAYIESYIDPNDATIRSWERFDFRSLDSYYANGTEYPYYHRSKEYQYEKVVNAFEKYMEQSGATLISEEEEESPYNANHIEYNKVYNLDGLSYTIVYHKDPEEKIIYLVEIYKGLFN